MILIIVKVEVRVLEVVLIVVVLFVVVIVVVEEVVHVVVMIINNGNQHKIQWHYCFEVKFYYYTSITLLSPILKGYSIFSLSVLTLIVLT